MRSPDEFFDLHSDDFTETLRRFTAENETKLNGLPKPEQAAASPRFKLVAFNALAVESDIVYLVKGLIPRTGLVVVWGPPKCGKSFWLFDLMMHPALGGRPYRERKTLSGPVVYCAFEGADGYGRRAEAFRRQHRLDPTTPVAFFLVPARMTFAKDHKALIGSIKAQLGNTQPVAVVLDTLNRSIGGSESDDEHMGNYIRAGDAVREAFNCVVIIVHHCGIEGTRPRGHTSLTGAVDAQLAVKRDTTTGQIVVTVEWMKDGPEGETVVSRLETVEVGRDPDGEPVTSCAVIPAEGAPEAGKQAKPTKLPKAAQTAHRALQKAVAEMGAVPPASNHIPVNTRVVTGETWRKYAYRMGISTGGERAQQKAFKTGTEHLIAGQLVGVWDNQYWPI
jgi:AAA domain-containing protein